MYVVVSAVIFLSLRHPLMHQKQRLQTEPLIWMNIVHWVRVPKRFVASVAFPFKTLKRHVKPLGPERFSLQRIVFLISLFRKRRKKTKTTLKLRLKPDPTRTLTLLIPESCPEKLLDICYEYPKFGRKRKINPIKNIWVLLKVLIWWWCVSALLSERPHQRMHRLSFANTLHGYNYTCFRLVLHSRTVSTVAEKPHGCLLFQHPSNKCWYWVFSSLSGRFRRYLYFTFIACCPPSGFTSL